MLVNNVCYKKFTGTFIRWHKNLSYLYKKCDVYLKIVTTLKWIYEQFDFIRSDARCSEIFMNLPTCIFYRVHPAGIWKLNRKYWWNMVPVFCFPLPVLIFIDVRDNRDSFCLCVLRELNFSFIFCFHRNMHLIPFQLYSALWDEVLYVRHFLCVTTQF